MHLESDLLASMYNMVTGRSRCCAQNRDLTADSRFKHKVVGIVQMAVIGTNKCQEVDELIHLGT